jgi:hypothetical protein
MAERGFFYLNILRPAWGMIYSQKFFYNLNILSTAGPIVELQ